MLPTLPLRFFTVLASLLVVVACETTPIEKLELPANAFNKQSRYAILWIKPCHTNMFGRCTPDDGRTTEARLAIHATSGYIDLNQEYVNQLGLSASIARINASEIIEEHYLRGFKNDLSERGLDLIAVREPFFEGTLPKRSSSRVSFADKSGQNATRFPLQVKSNTFDFDLIYQELGVDYLLVLELLRFSLDQHYGPGGSTVTNPEVVSAIRVYLHQRESGEVVFNDYAHNIAVSADDWDSPPHYQALADLFVQTLESSIKETKTNLLQHQLSE